MKSANLKQSIHLIIAVVIFVVLKLVLPVNTELGLTPAGASTLALFVAVIYAWLTYGTSWTSLLAIALVPFTGICVTAQALQLSIGNMITIMVLGMVILSYALNKLGVTRHIATWFITRKIANKRPYVFIFLFMAANMLVAYVMDAVPTQVVFCMLAKGILEDLGYTKEEKFSKALYLSSLWITCVGMCATPIGHSVVVLVMNVTAGMVGPISYLDYMLVGIPFSLLAFALMFCIIRFVIKPDCSKYDAYDVEKKKSELGKLSAKGKFAAFTYVCVIIMWLFPDLTAGILPGASAYVKALGTAVPPLLGVALLCLVRFDKEPCIDYADALRNISWPSVIFVGAIMMFSQVFSLETGGINVFLKNLIAPAFASASPTVVVAVALLLVLIFTNFASNMVAGTLALGAVLPIFLGMDPAPISLLGFSVMVSLMCNMGYWTPAGSATVALVMQDGYLTAKDIFKQSILPVVGVYVIAMVIIWPLAQLVF